MRPRRLAPHRLARRVQAAGLARGARLRDRRRSVGKRVRAISAARVRGRQALQTIDRLTAEIAQRARQTVREARVLARGARREAARRRASDALVEQLERELEAAEQVLAQTDLRLAGERTIPDRRVSLVDRRRPPDPDGQPARPTEFGYKARVADTAEGFVLVDVPARGNPGDDGLLDGAITKARASGMQLRTVYADRGFGTRIGDAALARHRIRDPVIPRRGRASPTEQPGLAPPLPLPQRTRGTDLATQAQGPTAHALAYPRRRPDLGRLDRPRPQPPADGPAHLIPTHPIETSRNPPAPGNFPTSTQPFFRGK